MVSLMSWMEGSPWLLCSKWSFKLSLRSRTTSQPHSFWYLNMPNPMTCLSSFRTLLPPPPFSPFLTSLLLHRVLKGAAVPGSYSSHPCRSFPTMLPHSYIVLIDKTFRRYVDVGSLLVKWLFQTALPTPSLHSLLSQKAWEVTKWCHNLHNMPFTCNSR